MTADPRDPVGDVEDGLLGEPTGWGDDHHLTEELEAVRHVNSAAWVMDVVLEDSEVSHCGHIDEQVIVPSCPHCREDLEHVQHVRARRRVVTCGLCLGPDERRAKTVMVFEKEVR